MHFVYVSLMLPRFASTLSEDVQARRGNKSVYSVLVLVCELLPTSEAITSLVMGNPNLASMRLMVKMPLAII